MADDSEDRSKEVENSQSKDQKSSDETAKAYDSNLLAAMQKLDSSLSELAKLATSSLPESQETREQNEHTQGGVIIRERVITGGQVGAFMDLGLGRGVDATNPTPWLNKSTFQVREVTFDNIIGTEEGNLYQGFVNEVESTQNLQTNLKASIPLNQQVNLGIDSELSRSYSSTQKSVGRKIITRTIAFRANSDISETDSQGKSEGKSQSTGQVNDQGIGENGHDQGSVEENDKKKHPEKPKKSQVNAQAKFEDHLREWILQRIEDDKTIKQIEGAEENSEGQKIETFNRVKCQEIFDNCTIKDLSEFCYKFVKTFSITHYVHSLELGASHYRVMSEEEYTTKIRSKGSLGAAQMADIAIGVEGTKTSKKLQRQTTKIGRMKVREDEDSKNENTSKQAPNTSKQAPGQECGAKEDEVKRGSIEEAVVGVKVHPISTLVGNVKLRRALQDALQYFIQNKQKIKYGPFFICCSRESIFLSVSDSCQIEATQDINHASEFYIVRCDEGDDHFYIVHEAPTSLPENAGNVTKFENMPPIPMYLRASMNWRRRSTPTKPLMMEMNVNSRLSIHSRRDKEFHPAKLTEWVSQKEVFFIKCENQAKLFPKSSYLCVYQPKGDATYVTGCKPTIRSDDSKRFMLFRLICKLQENEVTTCTSTSSTPHFLIKFRQCGSKDVFFKVSEDCKEVDTTLEKAKASTFYLKVHKCNYFKILYKNASDQVYHLYAPAKLIASSSSRLSLSLREDASTQSYMAFYYAQSHSRRLHQRELSDLLKSGKEDETELHITCQCSVDSDSRRVSDLYAKLKENSFHVKAKHGKKKFVEEKRDAGASLQHFNRFVLLVSQDSPSVGSKDSRQSQGSDSNSAGKGFHSMDESQTSASKVSPSTESSQQVKCEDIPSKADSNHQQGSAGKDSEIPSKKCSKQAQHSTGMDSETPSTEDSKRTQYSLSTSMDSETPSTKDLKQTQHLTGTVSPTTEDSKQTQHSTGMDSENPSTISKDSKQTQHSSTAMNSETPSTKDSKQKPHSSTDTDSKTPSTKDLKQTAAEQSTGMDSDTPSVKSSKLIQYPTGIVSTSTEDSMQIQESAVDSKLEGMGQEDCHDNNFCAIM